MIKELIPHIVIAAIILNSQRLQAHDDHNQSKIAQFQSCEKDSENGRHCDLYRELPDDSVYVAPLQDLMEDPNFQQNPRGYINPFDGGRLFVDGIEGNYLQLKKGEVVITIDDGPTGGNVTSQIIDILNDYNIRGVFFVVGNRVSSQRTIMEKMVGVNPPGPAHIVGNHTYNHELDFSSAEAMYTSLSRALRVTRSYMFSREDSRCYVRTPGGVWNNWRKSNLNLDAELRQCIGPFYWNIGGGSKIAMADWQCWSKGRSSEKCAEGYYQELLAKGKGIILMHDLSKKAPDFLRGLLRRMEREGIINKEGSSGFWNFVNLDKLESLNHLEVPGVLD